MLDVARKKVEAQVLRRPVSGDEKWVAAAAKVDLRIFDLLDRSDPPECALGADAVISTLMIEHVPVRKFFSAVYRLLKPGGMVLVTNMHPEMSGISQAGFMNLPTGEKIRPHSYAHRIEDLAQGAEEEGFDNVGPPLEVAVGEPMCQYLGPRAKKWIGITVWLGMTFRKRA